MSREQAMAALEAGIGMARELGEEIDLFGTGDMGIGNTTPSAAIVAAIHRGLGGKGHRPGHRAWITLS